MKRVELKRVAEILWKGNPVDEKTPFADRGPLPDNGSFSKNFDPEDTKKPAKELSESEDELSSPMSIPRKICFAVSFNMWIIYFLVLGWWLPCRLLECGSPFPDIVETNLSSIWPLANMEPFNSKGFPSLVMIGYGDGVKLKLAALAVSDSDFEWNNSLPFIPRKIQCNFGASFDANEDGIPDCLLSGFNDVYAYNATNGHVFWNQSIPSEEGSILDGFHPAATYDGKSFLIGACGDKMVAVDARNGTKLSEIDLPCDSPFEIRIVSSAVSNNLTHWYLVCDYGDKVEAWSFEEQDVLNGGEYEKKASVSKFALLFNGTNSGGSIDLGCDVTPFPGGPLLLSWADRVAMVTQEAIAWEQYFPEPLTLASVKVGHFTKSKELLIAVAARNSSDTIVYIMERKNGTVVDSVTLKDKQVQSMEKISDDIDLLVLRSRSWNYTSPPVYNTSDPIPMEETNFAEIDFSRGSVKVMDITTVGFVVGSTLNMQTNGATDLLVIKSENGFTFYQKYILHDIDSEDNAACLRSNHRHVYSLET